MKVTKDFYVDHMGCNTFRHTATVEGKEYHAEVKLNRLETDAGYPLERVTWQLRSMLEQAIMADVYKGIK